MTSSRHGDGPLYQGNRGVGSIHQERRAPHPAIFHSDNRREYEARVFVGVLERLGIAISRSHPGCPWENGYQESFYDKFTVELGDPTRFMTLGEKGG